MLGIIGLALATLVHAQRIDDRTPYEQARELYAEGPSRAPEVIELLKKQLELDPQHEKAIYLLGVTYFGIGNFSKALQQFEAGIRLAEKGEKIVPELLFYKARTLFELDRCGEAKKILDVYWAFWQGSDRLRERYDSLYPLVQARCGSAPEKEKK